MAYMFPEVREEKKMEFPWFPTAAECFIYRNWGVVSAKAMARALGCAEEKVLERAQEMGLDIEEARGDENWLTRGYVTIIRNNWHLLDYGQLCAVLDWTPEKLAFILKEDDFLDVKLGRFKPGTPELTLREMSATEQERLAAIAQVTRDARGSLCGKRLRPFAFFTGGQMKGSPASNAQRFEERIAYSYCAVYGDLFWDKEMIDASFPEEMLRSYQAAGVNGVWTQGVLSALAPFPFDESVSRDCDRRLEGMRYLCDRLEQYGIGLYLYFNEPRALPKAAFAGREDMKGAEFEQEACLCVSNARVREYLHRSIVYIAERVPKWAGIFTITASENHTNCYSHFADGQTNCPVCRARPRAEVIGEVNRVICEAALSVNPKMKVFAYTWGWEKATEQVCRAMPGSVGLMCVSEYDVGKEIGGVLTHVVDYSISVEGPGVVSQRAWREGRRTGRRTLAKVQMNNSWELAAAPMIPVLPRFYDHLRRLAEEGSVDGLLLNWTLGGYPSPALRMASCFHRGEIPELEDVLREMYPQTETTALLEALNRLTKAFDEYPFSVQTAYSGPQQMGPANLMYEGSTGFEATMVCYPYDDLDHWRGHFPKEGYVAAWERLCAGWEEGCKKLAQVAGEGEELAFLQDCAEACRLHFASVRDQACYQLSGEPAQRREILRREAQRARELIGLMDRNPCIGYEASNHYFYTRQNLFEKMVNCAYLLERM